MKKNKNTFWNILAIVVIISFISITVNNIYYMIVNERDYKMDKELLKQLKDYNKSWDEMKIIVENIEQ